jgi:hypothetical protein
MGIVIRLPQRHARASTTSRAAKAVKISAVTPALTARSVPSTADHHSAGSLSRCHHLETAVAGAPVSAAMASRDGQSSMMDRNEANSVMPKHLGQSVLKRKAIVSADCVHLSGHTVRMAHDDEDLAESQWREEFRQRIIAARGNRTQAVMAELLGILTNTYGKYEAPGRKSVMPVRLLPRFAKICGISLEDLIEGPKESASKQPAKPATKVPASRARRKAG